MVDTNIIEGCIYITTGNVKSSDTNVIESSANETVEIWSDKIDYDYQNTVAGIPITVSKGLRGTKDVETRAIDLKLVIISLSVNGQLADDTSESANTKRNNLLTLAKTKGGLRVLWGLNGNYRTIFGNTNTDKAFITKMTFTETTGIQGDAVTGDPQPFRKIGIIINFLIGKDI